MGAVVPATRTRWVVLLLISLMYMITYMDRSNISVAAPKMAEEFHLSKIALGLVFSAFLWAYAIGQIPGGWLADRFGPRKVLLLIVPFWSAMTALTAAARGDVSLIGTRFVFGLGEAGAFPTATRAMQMWFPKEERGLVQGMTHSFSRFAIAAVPPVAVAMMAARGWRSVFYTFALAGIVWSAVFYAYYRNRPEEHKQVNQEELVRIRGLSGRQYPAPGGGEFSGTVTGIMNMGGSLAASFSPIVFGVLTQRGFWIAPFLVTAGVLLAGALIWAFLIDPETPIAVI